MPGVLQKKFRASQRKLEKLNGDQTFTWAGTTYPCIWSPITFSANPVPEGWEDRRMVRVFVRRELFTSGAPIPSIDEGTEQVTVPITGDSTIIFGDNVQLTGDMTQAVITTPENLANSGHEITLDGDTWTVFGVLREMTGNHYILECASKDSLR